MTKPGQHKPGPQKPTPTPNEPGSGDEIERDMHIEGGTPPKK